MKFYSRIMDWVKSSWTDHPKDRPIFLITFGFLIGFMGVLVLFIGDLILVNDAESMIVNLARLLLIGVGWLVMILGVVAVFVGVIWGFIQPRKFNP